MFRDVEYMDQQLLVFYLSRKGLSALIIHDDLVATLDAEAMSSASVIRYFREAIFASSNPPDPLPPPEHQLDDSDQTILLRSPINPSHQLTSYHDSYTYQERLSTDD
jgi:hypothetical protein